MDAYKWTLPIATFVSRRASSRHVSSPGFQRKKLSMIKWYSATSLHSEMRFLVSTATATTTFAAADAAPCSDARNRLSAQFRWGARSDRHHRDGGVCTVRVFCVRFLSSFSYAFLQVRWAGDDGYGLEGDGQAVAQPVLYLHPMSHLANRWFLSVRAVDADNRCIG